MVEVKEEGEVTMPRGIKGWSLERGMEDDHVDEDKEKEGAVGSVNGEEKGKMGLDENAGREKEEKVMSG